MKLPYIEIIRQLDTGNQTLGKAKVYVWNKHKFAYEVKLQFLTLELPWKDNKNSISCIPNGSYKLTRLSSSPSFSYPHYILEDVENRTYIKIHKGNFVHQLLGCILPGDSFKFIDKNNDLDVTNSTGTLNEILRLIGNEGEITINSLYDIEESLGAVELVDKANDEKAQEIIEESQDTGEIEVPFVAPEPKIEEPTNHVEKPKRKKKQPWYKRK